MSFEKDPFRERMFKEHVNENDVLNKASSLISEINGPAVYDQNDDLKAKTIIDEANQKYNYEITINDVKRAEIIKDAFRRIDGLFTSDSVVFPSDALDIKLDSLTDYLKNLQIPELSASLTYYSANKIGLSGLVNKNHLNDFHNSKLRTGIVQEVKSSIVKSNAFTEWASDLGDSIEDLADEAQDVASDLAEEGREALSDLADGAENLAESAQQAVINVVSDGADLLSDLNDDASSLAQDLAETVVDAGEATCYLLGELGLGVLGPVENIADLIGSMAFQATGNPEMAQALLDTDITSILGDKLDNWYDGNQLVEIIGSAIENIGEVAVDLGLVVLALSGAPAIVTNTAIALYGLENAGDALNSAYDTTGELGIREILSALIAGTASVASLELMSAVNNYLLHNVAGTLAVQLVEPLANHPVFAGRLIGTIICTSMAAVDTTIFETSEMVTHLANVALELETDYDIIQALQDGLVSIGVAALIGGVSYNLVEQMKAVKILQKIFNLKNTPDYFQNLFRQTVSTREYLLAIQEKLPEGVEIDIKKLLLDEVYLRDSAETKVLREWFNSHKDEVIAEWERLTGQEWPRYAEDVIDEVTGNVVRRAGDYYEAHHVIPLGMGGTNAAANIVPLEYNDHKYVHSTDAYKGLRALLKQALKLTPEAYSAFVAVLASLL